MPEQEIADAGFPAYLHGISAIDSYLGQKPVNAVHILCGASLADLARLFEGLRYPGAALADAALDLNGKTWYFRCDAPNDLRQYRDSFSFLEFYQNCASRRFHDPHDIYPLLRYIRDGVQYGDSGVTQWQNTANINADPCRVLIDAAIILSRYFSAHSEEGKSKSGEINETGLKGLNGAPGIEEQRLALIRLLESANPAPGFELLKNSGFVAAYWPELAVLDDVDHAKEFHPEGNVWKHTMETLRYRKATAQGFDLRLSLALLLHDIGKPLAESSGRHRFSGHAELGERQACRFLERLGFEAPLTRDVCYLVRNHMLPAALPCLPLARTGEIMSSLLFPTLLELYRCDESSSFKGLDGYYQSSAVYQSYLKYRRSPYRSADGKKHRAHPHRMV
ncbi:MAG: HD domain-containing protein [Treponema sp.]|jgi:poly(A) polymerase|nr:HD domain-containing protein [Treponema sp.]